MCPYRTTSPGRHKKTKKYCMVFANRYSRPVLRCHTGTWYYFTTPSVWNVVQLYSDIYSHKALISMLQPSTRRNHAFPFIALEALLLPSLELFPQAFKHGLNSAKLPWRFCLSCFNHLADATLQEVHCTWADATVAIFSAVKLFVNNYSLHEIDRMRW